MTEGKLWIQGVLELVSPLKLGSGEQEYTDADILVDFYGRPYLPGTSLAGALRHHLAPIQYQEQALWNKLWGNASTAQSSRLLIQDAELTDEANKKVNIARRDGIKIDSKNGLVEHQKKYDYQVLEAGACFKLSLKLTFDASNPSEAEFIEHFAATLVSELKSRNVHIGGKTNNGLGQVKLKDEKMSRFVFDEPQDVMRWWQQDHSKKFELKAKPFDLKADSFKAQLFLELNSALMIRAYPDLGHKYVPDDIQLRSGNQPVLPGSSIKGALRHRAERILNTLEIEAKPILDSLFGYIEENTEQAQKGKLQVHEVTLKNTVLAQQTRIKIDRFTGGTIESALFQTMPAFKLWSNPNAEYQVLAFTLRRPQDHEIGLLLLLIKDLWTSDLAIGGEKNVGRGRFQGHEAQLEIKGKTVILKDALQHVPTEDQEVLQNYLNSLLRLPQKVTV